MAHNLDQSNNRYNIAFLGSRNDVWHRHGQEMQPGQSIEAWAKEAGLNWEAIKVPALASLDTSAFSHIPEGKRMVDTGMYFNARSDTGAVISSALSDRHVNVQPIDVLNWFDRYVSVDDRFQLDVAGSLRGGAIIWATATFNGAVTVAGDKHVARLLMTTTFDASGATTNKATMTRVICNNTLDAALTDTRATIRTRHNTKFNPARVTQELAQLAKGFGAYKAVGDALAQNEMAREELSVFFKNCLDIPLDHKPEDISTRKTNQFREVVAAYKTTVGEGAPAGSAWAALNAITRYVDHDRSTRSDTALNQHEARFTSAQFGSGAALKGKAMSLLMPRIKDRVSVVA